MEVCFVSLEASMDTGSRIGIERRKGTYEGWTEVVMTMPKW